MSLLESCREIALACRILASTGLTTPLLGHVSLRVDDEYMLVRCRGPQERGLLFTTIDDIRLVPLSGSGEVGDGYSLPNEFPIHAEIFRARPGVSAVLHAHPRAALLAGLGDVALAPVFGAYDLPAYRLAVAGVPIYPHAGLVRTSEAGRALARALGDRPVCLLRGHGVVTAGSTAPEVLAHLMAVEALLSVSVDLARLDATPAEVPPVDLPDLGHDFNVSALWRHHVALLDHRGLADVG